VRELVDFSVDSFEELSSLRNKFVAGRTEARDVSRPTSKFKNPDRFCIALEGNFSELIVVLETAWSHSIVLSVVIPPIDRTSERTRDTRAVEHTSFGSSAELSELYHFTGNRLRSGRIQRQSVLNRHHGLYQAG
jgi:hypothetical protein